MSIMTKEELRGVRVKAKMTRQKFATALNVSYASIRAWETGERNISPTFAEKVQAFDSRGQVSSVKSIIVRAGDVVTIRGEQ